MSKKLNNKKEYKIDSEKIHFFLVCCDRIDVEFYEIMQYSTQLLILADAYYDEQYDRVLICECICSSIRYLFDIVAKEYDMISEYRNSMMILPESCNISQILFYFIKPI